MAIVLDGSSPVAFKATPGTSITSASFTPPLGSLIRFKISCAYGGATDPTMSSTGGGLGSWRQVGKKATGAFSGANTTIYIYEAAVTSSVATTVKADFTSTGTQDIFGWVEVWTGANSTQTTAATASNTGVGFPVTPFNTTGMATTAAGSQVHGIAAMDASGTLGSSDSGSGQTGTNDGVFSAYKAANTGSSGTSVQLNYTNTGNPSNIVWLTAEILAAGGVVSQHTDTPNRPRPGRGPFSKGLFRVSDTTPYTSVGISLLSGTSALVFAQSGTLVQPPLPFLEEPNRPRPGRGPFSKGRFYLSDTTAFTSAAIVFGSGTSAIVFSSSGLLTASGALTGTSALAFGQTGALTATGSLIGTSALVLGQTGTLVQPGLSGSASLVFGQTGALNATGVLAATSALQFGQTAALAGAGAITGASALTFAQAAALTAAGTLAGSSALTFAQTAALAATGTLAGTSAVTFAASATADLPAGALVGTSALSFGGSGTLSAFGALIGNCQIVFDASANTGQANTQPGPVDSPRIAEGYYRRKKKLRKLERPAEPVFIAPASLERLPQAVIDRVPDFTTLAQTLGEPPALLSARIDSEIAHLMQIGDERDDEEALAWILKVID